MPSQIVFFRADQVRSPGICSKRGIAVVVPAGTVDIICSRLDGNVDDCAGRSAEFGRVAVRLDFEFTDGVGRWLDDLGRQRLRVLCALIVVESVENEVVLRMVIAVGDEPPGSAGNDCHRAVRHAGDEQCEFGVTPTACD